MVGISGEPANQLGAIQGPLPLIESQTMAMAGVQHHLQLSRMKARTHTLTRMTLREWIITPVMVDNLTPRVNPKERGNINPLTMDLESVEEIPTILEREETCVKERNGTTMVCQLP